MMRNAYFTSKDGVTKRVAKTLGAKKRKPKKVKIKPAYGYEKQKYWCRIKSDDYFATSRHTHCKLCWTELKGDLHEIELYEKV